jgi:prepilin signal peptidase PulO-like enzyme (type II secretory pathway)
MAAASAAAIVAACAAAVVDARTGLIPDRISGCGAAVTLAVAGLSGTLAAALAGAAAVAGSLLALFVLTRGRGLGLGDVKLGVTIGAGCGPGAGLLALGTAFVAGALFAAMMVAAHRMRRRDAIPFAPFLAAGTIAGALPGTWG